MDNPLQLINALPTVQDWLERISGYDRVTELRVYFCLNGEACVEYYARDNFQDSLSYSVQYRQGHQNFQVEEIEDLYKTLHKIPSRSERELRVLLRQTASATEHREELQSATARAFAERLLQEHRRNQHLLEEISTAVALDDEIPF